MLNLEAKVLKLENDKQELQKEKENLLMKSIPEDPEQVHKFSTDQLVEAMSRVSLKDEEIKVLKVSNDKINSENESLKEEISMLKLKLIGNSQLQGAKHFLWDKIIDEVFDSWDYLIFIEDKRELTHSISTKCQVPNEILHKRPVNVAHKTIIFLHQTSNETLRTLGLRDRFVVIIYAKKIIEKHNLMNEVKAKAELMRNEVHKFEAYMKLLFEKGYPSFWDKKGKLHKKEEYVASVRKVIHDNSKFQSMEGNIKGEEIIDKLGDDFSVLYQFQIIKEVLPSIYFSSCVELEVLQRELGSFELSIHKQWNEVEKFVKIKYTFYNDAQRF